MTNTMLTLYCPKRQTDTDRETILSRPHPGGIPSTESAAQHLGGWGAIALVSLEACLPGGQSYDPKPTDHQALCC